MSQTGKKILDAMSLPIAGVAVALISAIQPQTALADYGVATFTGATDNMYESALGKSTSWSNGIAPNNANAASWDYVLSSTSGFRSPVVGGRQTFEVQSHSFAVGVVGGAAGAFRDCNNDSGSLKFNNDGLVLAKGTWYRENSREVENAVAGKVRVTAPQSDPFLFYGNATTGCGNYQFLGAWSSDVGTRITFASRCSKGKDFRVKFLADCPSFNGDLRVAAPEKETYSPMQVLFGDIDFNGNVLVGSKAVVGTVAAGNSVTVGSLDLADDAEIRLMSGGHLSVKRSLVVNGHVRIVVRGFSQEDLAAGKVVLLSMEESCSGSVDPDAFDLDLSQIPAAQLPKACALGLSEDERSLELNFHPTVWLLKRNAPDNSANPDASAVNDATAWSDAREVHSGADYVVGALSGIDVLRTVYEDPGEFIGDSLTFLPGSTLAEVSRNWTVRNLVFYPNTTAKQVYSQGNHNWYGEQLAVLSDPLAANNAVTIVNYFNNHLTIHHELVGDGNLVLQANGSSSWPNGYFCLNHDNSNYKGSVKVTITSGTSSNRGESPSLQNYAQLDVSHKNNLGGPLDAFNPKALVLEQMSVFRCSKDVTLDEPTRGVYIGNMGRFDVPVDYTLTIASPLAVNGELRKEGRGVLCLGGPLSFGEEGTSETPVEGKNILTVAAGAIKPLSTDCLNGLTVTLTSGTKILLAADPQNADLARYGIRNTKAEVPFSVQDDGPIVVELDFGEQSEIAHRYSVGVMTVKASLAKALGAKIRLNAVPRGYNVEIVSVPNPEDESVTLKANVSRRGLVVVFK